MILGLVGAAGAGKTTVAEHLVATYGYAQISFAEPLKRLCCEQFGWDFARLDDPEYKKELCPVLGIPRREALKQIGMFFRGLDPDHWVKPARRSLDEMGDMIDTGTYEGVSFADVRFDNEVQLVKDAGGLIVLIERTDGLTVDPDGGVMEELHKRIVPDYTLSAAFGIPNVKSAADAMMKLINQFDGEGS